MVVGISICFGAVFDATNWHHWLLAGLLVLTGGYVGAFRGSADQVVDDDGGGGIAIDRAKWMGTATGSPTAPKLRCL